MLQLHISFISWLIGALIAVQGIHAFLHPKMPKRPQGAAAGNLIKGMDMCILPINEPLHNYSSFCLWLFVCVDSALLSWKMLPNHFRITSVLSSSMVWPSKTFMSELHRPMASVPSGCRQSSARKVVDESRWHDWMEGTNGWIPPMEERTPDDSEDVGEMNIITMMRRKQIWRLKRSWWRQQ